MTDTEKSRWVSRHFEPWDKLAEGGILLPRP